MAEERSIMKSPHARTAWIAATGLASLLAALATAACGASAAPATGGSGGGLEKTHMTVGALPVVDDAPLFLAIKNGYFKQQGLTVTPKIIPQSTLAIPDMLHGTVDIIGTGNYVSFFEGQAQGTFSIKVLAAGAACKQDSFSILAMPASGIKGPAGLAGKTIAVNLTNNIQTLMTDAVLKANGVSPASVKYVVVPFPNMAAALKAGRVDAISVVEPFLTSAEQTVGAVPVTSECSGSLVHFPLSGYFATAAWTAKYPHTAHAFHVAMAKAQAFAGANPAAVQNVLPTYTKIPASVAPHIKLNDFPVTMDPAQLQRVPNLMLVGGLLKGRLDVQPLLFH
jgi:NitT/TauT family transport system substrate-binding protein